MDEIIERFRGPYEELPVPGNGGDPNIMTIVEDMLDVDLQRYDGLVGIPMPPLQHPLLNEDDTSSTLVHPSNSRPHTPSADLDSNSGLSSVSNWSGTTLVDSGELSADGESLSLDDDYIPSESGDSNTEPLMECQYQPTRSFFRSRHACMKDGEGVVRRVETELDFKEANHDDLMDGLELRAHLG
jgi:hypothetical protein